MLIISTITHTGSCTAAQHLPFHLSALHRTCLSELERCVACAFICLYGDLQPPVCCYEAQKRKSMLQASWN